MKVLVIAPHPDDEILGVGGTMAKYIDEGHDVYVCIVTKGHSSMYSENRIKKVTDEALIAHEKLGVKKTIFLDFPAVMLSEVPKHELNGKLTKLIDEIKPEIVFIPHFGDMHLDHYIIAQSSMVAMRPIKDHKVLEIYSYETLSETEWNVPHLANAFNPNVYFDISEYMDKKLEAMRCFESQVTEFPHPRSIKAISSLAALRGSTVGVNAAEAMCLIRKTIS